MKLSKITYQDWSEKLVASAIALLQQHKETALFLLDSLTEYGPHRTDAIFSGDYKCLVYDGKAVAAFLLNGMGRLLLQTDKKADYSRLIIDAISPVQELKQRISNGEKKPKLHVILVFAVILFINI